MQRLLLLALGLGVALGCRDGGNRVFAPPPARLFERDDGPTPPLPKTVVEVPMLLDLTAAIELMETALPARFGNIDRRQPIPGKKRGAFAYEIWREPFTVSIRADTFLIASTIHYQGKGWYNPPIGPEVGGSCGLKGQEPRARLVVSVRPELNRDWQLVARPKLRALAPLSKTERDQCEVSFLKLDVTSKVLAAARSAINAQLPKIGARLAEVNVRREFEKVWRAMQQPIRLADSVWLTLAPDAIRLGRVSGADRVVGATIGIDAEPRIETGSRPTVAERPLPPLEPASPSTGLSLLVEGHFDYATIGESVTKALKGKEVKPPGGSVVIEEVRVFGVGRNRVALGVTFSGTTEGQIYFVGTPQYDSSSGRIVVPDLDYDASTAGTLVRGLAWLKADDIRNYLRAKATFPSAEAIERLSDLATKGMNRQLTPGISLSASTNRTEVLRILARPNAIVVQARALGQAALIVEDGFFRRFQNRPGAGSASESDTTLSAADGKSATPPR